MKHAPKKKKSNWLFGRIGLFLLLALALFLPQNRVWGFSANPVPEVGQILTASSMFIGENCDQTQYDASGYTVAPKSGSLYHYTSDGAANSILKQGITPGRDGFSYLTNKGKLSPIQAQIELALPANRQLPNALLKIDAGGLRKTGINPVFGPRRVQGNLPGLGSGGGTELLFDQAIPSQFIQRVH